MGSISAALRARCVVSVWATEGLAKRVNSSSRFLEQPIVSTHALSKATIDPANSLQLGSGQSGSRKPRHPITTVVLEDIDVVLQVDAEGNFQLGAIVGCSPVLQCDHV